ICGKCSFDQAGPVVAEKPRQPIPILVRSIQAERTARRALYRSDWRDDCKPRKVHGILDILPTSNRGIASLTKYGCAASQHQTKHGTQPDLENGACTARRARRGSQVNDREAARIYCFIDECALVF